MTLADLTIQFTRCKYISFYNVTNAFMYIRYSKAKLYFKLLWHVYFLQQRERERERKKSKPNLLHAIYNWFVGER